MTGSEDAAAAEAAQIQALRRRADERREELGETLAALSSKLAGNTDLRAWARREAKQAASRVGHATAAAARRALLPPPAAGAAQAALHRATAGGRARPVIAAAVPATVLAMAAWWWWHSKRRGGRRLFATGR